MGCIHVNKHDVVSSQCQKPTSWVCFLCTHLFMASHWDVFDWRISQLPGSIGKLAQEEPSIDHFVIAGNRMVGVASSNQGMSRTLEPLESITVWWFQISCLLQHTHIIYIYIYIIYIYIIYIYIHTDTYSDTYTYTYAYRYRYTYTHVYIYIYTHISTYVHTYRNIFLHITYLSVCVLQHSPSTGRQVATQPIQVHWVHSTHLFD